MEQSTMETISAAYTVYTLLNPADRLVLSIESFAEAFKTNLALLENTAGSKGTPETKELISQKKIEESLQRGMPAAEETLDDKEKLSSMLKKLKEKMKSLPMVGNVFANLSTMFRLLNSYLKGEYTDIPRKQLIIIVSGLSYLIAPIDPIPDFIPVIGLVDDMAILSLCINATKGELEKYLSWREKNGLSNTSEEETE